MALTFTAPLSRALLVALCLLQGAHAKGMHSMFKEMVCKQVKISLICGPSTPGSPTVATCTGAGCCAKSSCYSNIVPNFNCKGSRGKTSCVGGNMIALTKGTCQCQQGVCSATGDCADASATPSASGFMRLYDGAEERAPIEEEDFTAAFAASGLLSIAFLAALASLALRGRKAARRAATGPQAGLIGSFPEAVE